MEKLEGATRKRYDKQSDKRSEYVSWQSDGFGQTRSQNGDQSSWRHPNSSSEVQSWNRASSSGCQSGKRRPNVCNNSDPANTQGRPEERFRVRASALRSSSDGFGQTRSQNGDQSSWRHPNSSREVQSWNRASSSGGQSGKRPNVCNNSEPANTKGRPEERFRVRASALQLGKVLNLDLIQGYGFLAPIGTVAQSNNVYFRFEGTSNVETGMLQLQVGDIFEFVSNELPDRPRAIYACLVQCIPRSSEALTIYLDTLLSQCLAGTGSNVLRDITKCPAGLLQVLNLQKPGFNLVCSVLELVNIISHGNEAELYAARLKQFYRLFSGTTLLHLSLKEYIVDILNSASAEKLLKKFLIRLADYCPETVSDVLPLLNDMVFQIKSGENIGCHCQFLLGLLTAQAGNAISSRNANLSWNKMPLLPEITGLQTDDEALGNCLKGLPCVKKKGSYGSIDVYMDTYFRLLQEDCFRGLKKGISALRKKSLQDAPRNLKIWKNGYVLGIHFGGSYSGITVAIQVEKLKNCKGPLSGSLLCLSDDGGNFESPIWGVVGHCEDSVNGIIMFAGIVDGRGGAGEVEIQAIGRLLCASSNIVMAESPTFYKAYQPVLKALQEKDMENFPFTEELVYAEWPNKPPAYLTPMTTLNWRCIFNEEKESPAIENISNIKMRSLSFMASVSTGTCLAQGHKSYNVEASVSSDSLVQMYNEGNAMRGQVHELDNLIKSGYKTSLDDSQIKAIKLALRNRVALIQGPPGTGKSYVGVKMLELLLTADSLPLGPILVMTYKNHALDQFLLSCLKFCPNLVRIGGRSEEPDLMPHNLSSKIGRMNEHRSDWIECTLKLEQVQAEMEIALQQLRESSFLNAESLMDSMPEKQVRQLISKNEFGRDLLKQFPEEISLLESIRSGVGRGEETRNLVTSLYKTLSKNIREWMPKRETFELVENCFSIVKPLQRLDETGYSNTSDTGSEDGEQTSDEEEYEVEIDVPSNHDTRNKSWLEENFFPCRREANDSWSSGGAKQLHMHIDLNRYQWLLYENPWHLNQNLRVLLVHVITQAKYEKALKSFADIKSKYAEICEVMQEINQLRQLEVLRESKIVGMTTTGAALYRDVLKKLQPAIIFVEEASEILEPQLLAALEPTIQHLILIGDHYQLPPRVSCYELERWHGFEVSMFERLVEHNKMPFQSLAVQSRMREEFLPMLLPIYPHLRSNTKLVTGERNGAPACMMSSMYFWSHSYPDTGKPSYANKGEAAMVVALVRSMIAEGEDPNNITIIGAYRGQVSVLRKELETCQGAENVQVHTIDRFQGSENKTVVVSLVRSNEEGNIGFLAKRNRLCVSVSRARGALYFCGSSDTFAAKSPHWKTLFNYFQDQNCLGEQIYMRCPRHPFDPPFTICSSEVNSFHPLLCERPCRDILNCNHQCQGTCHHGEHQECSLTVQFLFKDCGHEATKRCSEKEETISCKQDIPYTFEACQHTEVLKCWRVTRKNNLNCMQVCPKKLECGHPCTLKCYQNCKANPCSICVKIEKDKAEKEKLREQEERQLKMKELENEIERLKNAEDSETSLKELDSEGETAAEYFQVMDRTEKYIQPKHDILPIVTKIEKVRNPKLQLKFVETQRDLICPMAPTQLLFHGTSDDSIQGIVEKGFRLPTADKINMFGQGIYFATDSQKIYTKGSNKLLLCEVLLGGTLTVQKAQADLNKEKVNKKGYDSLFSKREGNATGGTLFDEFVVYDPYQAIPRYIVHYNNLSFDPAAMAPSPISGDQNLTRIQYEMSLNFIENSAAEYHFRVAESQFFRMSSRIEHKVVMVELIINKTLQNQFEKVKVEFGQKKISFKERLVFHGTDRKAIEKIIEEGFKIGGEGVEVRNGAKYGTGVYTAVDPTLSIPYSKRGNMMLLSIALLDDQGKEYSQGHSADVVVMKRAEHLLPKYIVHYTKNDKLQ